MDAPQLTISSVDKAVLKRAAAAHVADYEDAVQYFSALRSHAYVIVTRDEHGFFDFDLPVLSPSVFVALSTQ